jgi:hypothetical protein
VITVNFSTAAVTMDFRLGSALKAFGLKARFNESRLEGAAPSAPFPETQTPGALPQAANELAPLALGKHIRKVRLPIVTRHSSLVTRH